MANTNDLFHQFCTDLEISSSKQEKIMTSREHLRKSIRDHFAKNHPKYCPTFFIQGSWKMKTAIRTKDDTCDLDDGVYFDSNPDKVAPTTLQKWVKEAVDNITDTTATHKKMCITVDYKAGYNIDLPVYLFEDGDEHPYLAVKNESWDREDDPREMVRVFQDEKKANGQILRIVKHLKAWCDYKRDKMPSGLAMTILAMNNFASNYRDDVALKNTLIAIERALKPSINFRCIVPATPNDDIFENFSEVRKDNFMNNLASFITDAKKAVDDEKNYKKASELWRKHLGSRFPLGEDKEEESIKAERVATIIGASKPYAK